MRYTRVLAAALYEPPRGGSIQMALIDDNYLGWFKQALGGLWRRGYRESFEDRSKASGMPGKKITDHQVRKYKQDRKTLTQVAAAARAGISERSARRIDETDALPSQREARSWRTREDPLSELWDGEVVPLLQTDVLLNAVTLLEELQRRHPGLPIGVVPELVQDLLLAATDLHVLGPTEPLLHVLDDHFRVVPLGGGPATGSGPRDRVEQPCGGRQHARHDDRAGGLEPEQQPDQSAEHERLGDGHEEDPTDV